MTKPFSAHTSMLEVAQSFCAVDEKDFHSAIFVSTREGANNNAGNG